MNRDELFINLALKTKLLTQAQLDDCRKLREMLAENSFQLSLSEIVSKKEFLNPDQIRLINVSIRYEEQKRDDEELGAFIVRKGFLPQEKINECLTAQSIPFKEGRHFPRLEEQLTQKAYLTPQQMHVILRAREQLEQAKRDGGSSPRMPRMQPSLPMPEPEPSSRPASPQNLKVAESGLQLETLKVEFRKAKLQGDSYAAVLDVNGALDGATSRKFDEYLQAVTAAGFVCIVLCCEKLKFISSAGIGVLAGAIKRCRDGHGDLRLSSVDERTKRVMHMIGMLSLVRLYDHERGAINSFKYG